MHGIIGPCPVDLAALPHDVETLHRMIGALVHERDSVRAEAEAEIARLKQILRSLQRLQFGRRSEQLDPDQLELGLEDVAHRPGGDGRGWRAGRRAGAPCCRCRPASRPAGSSSARGSHRRGTGRGLSLLWRRPAPCRRERERYAGLRAGPAAGDPHPPPQVRLPVVRHDPPGARARTADREGPGNPGAAVPCPGVEVL